MSELEEAVGMRTINLGIVVVWGAFCASIACGGGDGGNGGTAGSDGSGAQQSGTSGSAGTGPGSGSGGSGGGGSQAGSTQGGSTAAAECEVLSEGETGAHGLTRVYRAEGFGAFYEAIGIDGDRIYFTADFKLMSYPVAGGTATEVGPYVGRRQLVRGGVAYGFKPGANGALGSMVSAPITDTSTITTLAESIAEPKFLVADDTALYFDRLDPPSIFKVPLAGGTPEEIVPGGIPLGMISHLGNLYWLDFETNYLERVPVAGGARQRLAEVFFGGPMAADGDSVFWGDTSLNTIESWQEGATMTQKLDVGSGFFSQPAGLTIVGDTVYWVAGNRCGEVHRVKKDGSSKELYTQGTPGADWVGVAGGALFVLGGGGLFRVDL